jgi:hypothetical protein
MHKNYLGRGAINLGTVNLSTALGKIVLVGTLITGLYTQASYANNDKASKPPTFGDKAGTLFKSKGGEVLKSEAMSLLRERFPEAGPVLNIFFPESEGVDYQQIRTLVKDEITRANDDQTLNEANAKIAGMLSQLDDTISSDAIYHNERTLQSLLSQHETLKAELATYEAEVIEHGQFAVAALTQYLLLADAVIKAQRYIANRSLERLEGSDATLSNADQKQLLQDIEQMISRATTTATKVVVGSMATRSGGGWYPQGYECQKEQPNGIRWETDRDGNRKAISQYIKPYVYGPNGFRATMNNCGSGFEPDYITERIVAMRACETNNDWAPCYAQFHKGKKAASNKVLYGVCDQQNCLGGESPTSIGRLRKHYYDPYHTTQPFIIKWASLRACIETPGECTDQAWTDWISAKTIVDGRCLQENSLRKDYLGTHHPLCPEQPGWQVPTSYYAKIQEMHEHVPNVNRMNNNLDDYMQENENRAAQEKRRPGYEISEGQARDQKRRGYENVGEQVPERRLSPE